MGRAELLVLNSRPPPPPTSGSGEDEDSGSEVISSMTTNDASSTTYTNAPASSASGSASPFLDEYWTQQRNVGYYRTQKYDVYLPSTNPPPPTKGGPSKPLPQKKQKKKAILFFPGALVPHEAYSDVASYLAEQGQCIVVVMSFEPFRLATEYFGADQKKCPKHHETYPT